MQAEGRADGLHQFHGELLHGEGEIGEDMGSSGVAGRVREDEGASETTQTLTRETSAAIIPLTPCQAHALT